MRRRWTGVSIIWRWTARVCGVRQAPELDLGWPPGWDLGYPATVEMEPGELLTVYYQIALPAHKPSIQATRWSLERDRRGRCLSCGKSRPFVRQNRKEECDI